jgi:hypothetical protein
MPSACGHPGPRGRNFLPLTLLELRPDLDSIEALSVEREALWTRLNAATFLTPNEKRAVVGYGALSGGDELKSDPAGLTPIGHATAKARRIRNPSIVVRCRFGVPRGCNHVHPATATTARPVIHCPLRQLGKGAATTASSTISAATMSSCTTSSHRVPCRR